jgi:hypothetical protein
MIVRHIASSRQSRHGFRRSGTYRFHFTGVTASGVPLLELIQPVAVSLPSNGALSIGFQP